MPASQRSDQTQNPILVELHHGDYVESTHRGLVSIANEKGEIIWSLGQIEALTCIRSALKPLQALALLDTGAFDKLNLRDEHLAIACGSHSGEAQHIELVSQWLVQLGLSEQDLRCGCGRPLDSKIYRQLIFDHGEPTALHHNCSGKHAGFLSIATFLGVDTENYLDPNHPVQKRVLDCLQTQLDRPIGASDVNVDGCSAPNIFAPFQIFASAFGRFVSPNEDTPTAQHRQRILSAMARYPALVSGQNRFSALLGQASNGKIIGKSGAEGSYLAMVPGLGLAILVKIDDGAKRAAHTAILTILSGLGLLSRDAMNSLWPAFQSSQGKTIGRFASTDPFRNLTPDLIPKER